nr:hypothetical protein [uncultured bacterium]
MVIQVTTRRIQPLTNFKFVVKFEGETEPIAAVSKFSGLKRTTEVIEHRDGGMPSTPVMTPGYSKFEPITLERGQILDVAFEEWAQSVFSPLGDGGVSLGELRRNLTLEVLNLEGNVAIAWSIYGAWVTEYNAASELDANASAVLFESVVLNHHGFQRDIAVTEEIDGFSPG